MERAMVPMAIIAPGRRTVEIVVSVALTEERAVNEEPVVEVVVAEVDVEATARILGGSVILIGNLALTRAA